MCYFRHYNKSSNWYPFAGLDTFFVHQLPHRQQSAARQTKLRSDAASLKTIVDDRSPALVYSLLYTASDTVVALFEEYG